nr:immunoglobulin heavy chain junction region [Macaca mulatta]MOV36639.1 immunoglobulin heavy chain junction region [Macaca mulatta]MOV36724.1 immunoglobulin heavy chain junction region [Macaca mulatta]
CTARYGGFSFW